MNLDECFTQWDNVMNLPSQREIYSYHSDQRSPYIVCYPKFGRTDRYSEYSVDFRAEHLPKGTYLSLCNFGLDKTSLQKAFQKVYCDYEGVTGYAGFQRLEDGTTCAIMSIWNIYCESGNGRKTVIQPKVVFADNLIRSGTFGGEGNGIQCLVRYDWKSKKKYRMFLQIKDEKATGVSHLTMWAHDYEQDIWTKLIEYDLQIKHTFLMDSCVFLENYLSEYCAEIRTMELSDFRVFSDEGKWVRANAVRLGQSYNYPGSYNYGVQGNIIWGITTGLPNRCRIPAQWRLVPIG